MDNRALVEFCITNLYQRNHGLERAIKKTINNIDKINDYDAIVLCMNTQKYLDACDEFIERLNQDRI